jgi:hypothetical protein
MAWIFQLHDESPCGHVIPAKSACVKIGKLLKVGISRRGCNDNQGNHADTGEAP